MSFAGVERDFAGVPSEPVSFAGVQSDLEKDFTGVTWMLSDAVEETSFFVEVNTFFGVTGGQEGRGQAWEPPDTRPFRGTADFTRETIDVDASFSEGRSLHCFETVRTVVGQTATDCTWLVFTASLLKARFENPLLKDWDKWEAGTVC